MFASAIMEKITILLIVVLFCCKNVILVSYSNNNSPLWVAFPVYNNNSMYNPVLVNHNVFNNSYYPSNQSHNLIMGFPSSLDRLAADNIIKGEPFTRWGKSVKIFKFPPYGMINRQNITAIHIFDQITNGTGGWPYIIEGGIGSQNCTIKLKSRTGQAMNFRIQIYVNK